MSTLKTLLVERVGSDKNIGLITLNRPHSLNAFNRQQFAELAQTLTELENDPSIKVIILTGSGNKAFSAGMDLKEAIGRREEKMLGENNPDLTILSRIQKPVIAAVNGLAFGGGCEIAMSCDIIWASDRAQFGQPEVKVGLLPGLGGTQRLTRCVGKPLAMELCLTGRPMNAKEAKEAGLVARVVPHENLLVETIKLAEEIASKSSTVIKLIKEAVNRSQEVSLSEGLLFERRMFQAGLALPDAMEGIKSFVERKSKL